jgi:hypothetical protein
VLLEISHHSDYTEKVDVALCQFAGLLFSEKIALIVYILHCFSFGKVVFANLFKVGNNHLPVCAVVLECAFRIAHADKFALQVFDEFPNRRSFHVQSSKIVSRHIAATLNYV